MRLVSLIIKNQIVQSKSSTYLPLFLQLEGFDMIVWLSEHFVAEKFFQLNYQDYYREGHWGREARGAAGPQTIAPLPPSGGKVVFSNITRIQSHSVTSAKRCRGPHIFSLHYYCEFSSIVFHPTISSIRNNNNSNNVVAPRKPPALYCTGLCCLKRATPNDDDDDVRFTSQLF